MSVKVQELMSTHVVTVQPHHTISHAKGIFENNSFNTLPVVSSDGEAAGILSISDLVGDVADGAPVSQVMTEDVYTIPQYSDVQVAARMMRNHKIHHLLLTHEQQVVGVISSYDLLKLVEGHRYVMKNPSTPRKKGKGKRSKAES